MKTIFTLLFLLFSYGVFAQNLVPNHSFEILDSCPNNLNQTNYISDWFPIRITPDLFSTCYNGINNYCNVPSNSFGYQCPSNGENYTGYYAFFKFNNAGQELICAKLTDSLIINEKYFVSFKIVLSNHNANNYATAKHGVKFFVKYPPTNFTDVTSPTDKIVNNFAHFYSNQVVYDTLNWTTIKGYFIADSNYKYIAVGNFFSYSNLDTVYLGHNGIGSYYFLDDVCVSMDSNTCNIISQNGCLPDNIKENTNRKSITTYPNPANNEIIIDCNTINNIEKIHYVILDIAGNKVKQGVIGNKTKIDVSDIKIGIYIMQIKTSKENYINKIIKIN